MSTFDDHVDSSRLSALPPLPRDEAGPVFAEPWQAQAFALAVTLSDAGWFSWKEWAAALALELRAAAERGEPDDGSHYYEHWTAALEKLVRAKAPAGFASAGQPARPEPTCQCVTIAHTTSNAIRRTTMISSR